MLQVSTTNVAAQLIGQSYSYISVLGLPSVAQDRYAIEKELIAGTIYSLRKANEVQPHGGYDRDGRWYPNYGEHCECCDDIRKPSTKYWFSYKDHCRTARHIGNMLGVDAEKILAASERIQTLPESTRDVMKFAAISFLEHIRCGNVQCVQYIHAPGELRLVSR